MPRRRLTACVLVALVLAAGGCGGGGGDEGPSPAEERKAELSHGGRTGRGSPANPPPKGASPLVRELYRQFPPPQANAKVRGSSAAVRTGQKDCAGKTPVEVKEIYFPIAVEEGRIEPGSPEAEAIEEIDRFESHVAEEPSFAAGQLATTAYRETKPKPLASFYGRGCVYALAKGLERRVSDGG